MLTARNYDKSPTTRIKGFEESAWQGYHAICEALILRAKSLPAGKKILVIECYPGTDKAEVLAGLSVLAPALILDSDLCAYSGGELDRMMQPDLTDDRVFGIMTTKTLQDYYRAQASEAARKKIEQAEDGIILVIGTGASLIHSGDLLVYCDLTRWEIQLRYRAGMSNWNTANPGAPTLSKYKRGFFIEWRLADKLKKSLLDRIDFIMDTNKKGNPVMISGEAFREGLRQLSAQPFRLQPYFDPGVWGGQWMKNVCGLDEESENFAWSFDGVPEENSINLQFGDVVITLPAIDLVFCRPRELLGDRVHARFGTQFPIRFDLLDTMGGQNLSLQVHPLTEYIQEKFNMRYTQDESYYILDVGEDNPCVYLGLKSGAARAEVIRDLHRAESGEAPFPACRHLNRIPVKKHDHILIPAGTVHCSGRDTMVLEISATPYIFTFKLWDWGRVGLDGLPRPIHIEHGTANIQWDRDTEWVTENLIGQAKPLYKEDGILAERTGLHRREFIDTVRYTFSKPVICETNDSVHMLNLVEGHKITVSSPDSAFEPFTVHYAETFIVPAQLGTYCLEPDTAGGPCMVIQASVRG